MSDPDKKVSRITENLNAVGLTPPQTFCDCYPHRLSGRYGQRVAVAAVLVMEPARIVADEPVSMLHFR